MYHINKRICYSGYLYIIHSTYKALVITLTKLLVQFTDLHCIYGFIHLMHDSSFSLFLYVDEEAKFLYLFGNMNQNHEEQLIYISETS